MPASKKSLSNLTASDFVGRWEIWNEEVGGRDDMPDAVLALGKNYKFHSHIPDKGTLTSAVATSIMNDYRGRWRLKYTKDGRPYLKFILHRFDVPAASIVGDVFSWASSPVVYTYDRILHPLDRNLLKDLHVFDYSSDRIEVKEVNDYGPGGYLAYPTYLVKTDDLYV